MRISVCTASGLSITTICWDAGHEAALAASGGAGPPKLFERRRAGWSGQALEIGKIKGGVDRHVGEQIEGERGVVAQDAEDEERFVPVRAGLESPTRGVNRLGNFKGASPAGPLIEQISDKLARARKLDG